MAIAAVKTGGSGFLGINRGVGDQFFKAFNLQFQFSDLLFSLSNLVFQLPDFPVVIFFINKGLFAGGFILSCFNVLKAFFLKITEVAYFSTFQEFIDSAQMLFYFFISELKDLGYQAIKKLPVM